MGLLLMVVASLSVPAFAKSKEEAIKQITVDDIVAKMKKQLELTDQQVIEVKPIVENYVEGEKQLRLQEKKDLSKVLTEQQLYSWNFILNDTKKSKKKKLF